MTLEAEERSIIVEHRLQRAYETLAEAKDLINLKRWHGSANRLYYACYYAVTALLTENGYTAQTHGDAIGLFGKHFVLTNIFTPEDNRLYRKLFDLRQNGDYSDWIDIEEKDIAPLVVPAEKLIKTIDKLIKI